MASTLKINTLTGVSTAGSIAVTGEGNSTTTNLQQGLAKQWHQHGSSITVRDTFNVTGGTDNGTGDYTYTFTNSMGNDDYACSGLVIDSAPRIGNISAIATGSYTVQYHNESGESRDSDAGVIIHGDLA